MCVCGGGGTEKERHTDRQTDRDIDRQTDRQASSDRERRFDFSVVFIVGILSSNEHGVFVLSKHSV